MNLPDLNIYSLLAASLTPFVFFLYQFKFWHDPKILKMSDLVLRLWAIFGLLIVSAKVVQYYQYASKDYYILAALHALPLILTFFIVDFKSPLAKFVDQLQPNTQAKPTTIRPKKIEGIRWDDLIISDDLKNEMLSIVELLKNPKTATQYGIGVPKGIMLYGPPGTGKTSLARAIASNAGLSFFAISIDEILHYLVGESEKNLSLLFAQAQKHRPSIIFIDEIDTIGRSRSGQSAEWSQNLLNHLLQLIDGIYKTEGVYVIGATNRPDMVDPALKRAGRLNKAVEVPMPDFNSRIKLFALYLRSLKLAEGVNLEVLARLTEGLSPADIREICNQAGLNSFQRESRSGEKRDYSVTIDDLKKALEEFVIDTPSDSVN